MDSVNELIQILYAQIDYFKFPGNLNNTINAQQENKIVVHK